MDVNVSLIKAASSGNLDLLNKCLKDYDCDVDTKSESGCTALILAAWNNNENCVRALLCAGADTRLTDNDGTALDNARKQGHDDVAHILEIASTMRTNSWEIISDSEIASTKEYSSIEQKVTRIFNFKVMTMKEITQNIETNAESSFILHFSDIAVDKRLVEKAKRAFVNRDGVVDDKELRLAINSPIQKRRIVRTKPKNK